MTFLTRGQSETTMHDHRYSKCGWLDRIGIMTAVVLMPCWLFAGEDSPKVDIVLFVSDDHGWADSGAYGDPNVKTPVLDKLATEGVSFSRAYSNCPICTPSRGTIFSGRHAHSGPVSGFFDVYKATAPSTATELKKAGYRTAYIGKWHCGVVRDQFPESFRNRAANPGNPPTRTAEYHRAGFEDWKAFEVINAPFDSFVYENDNSSC